MVDILEVHHDSLVALIVYTNNNLIGSNRYLVYAGKNSRSKRDSRRESFSNRKWKGVLAQNLVNASGQPALSTGF